MVCAQLTAEVSVTVEEGGVMPSHRPPYKLLLLVQMLSTPWPCPDGLTPEQDHRVSLLCFLPATAGDWPERRVPCPVFH